MKFFVKYWGQINLNWRLFRQCVTVMGRRGQGRGRRHYQWPFYDFLRAVCRWFSASIAAMTMLHATYSNTLGPR